VGKVARRTIRAGTAIRTDWLSAANAVERGETVQVEVREGGAVVQLTGEAQRSGAVGQTIPVLNPMSKAVFKGRVEAKGKVTVGGTR
jgi:flagella basal body P-ring formation protein FlgA